MSLPEWPIIIYAVYVPLFLSLYVLVLIVIRKHRKQIFNSSFYSIFSVLSVVNIAACLVSSFVFRLQLSPHLHEFYASLWESNGWLIASYAGVYYLNCLSDFLGVLLAANRCTALYFPLKYEQIWSRALIVGIGLCFFLSALPVRHILNCKTYFVEFHFGNPRGPPDTLYVFHAVERPGDSIWFNMALESLTCMIASALLYTACLIRLCIFSITRHQTAERNLFLIGILTMIFSIPYMTAMASNLTHSHNNENSSKSCQIVYYISIYKHGEDIRLLMFFLYHIPWLTDLKYLSPALMVIITNQSIRRVIRKTFSKPPSNSTTITLPKAIHVTSPR